MGSSRITDWDEITNFTGTESLAVDDGLNKKVLASRLIMPTTTSGTISNMTFSSGNNTINVANEGSCVPGGQNNEITSNWALAFGKGARVSGISGGLGHTAKVITTEGDCNSIQFQIGGRTTDGTTDIFLSMDGPTDYVEIQDDSVWSGECYVVAVDEANGDASVWRLPFASKMVSGSASRLFGSGSDAIDLVDEITIDGPSTPEVDIDPAGFFRIKVLGSLAKNIKWSARVQLSEVRF